MLTTFIAHDTSRWGCSPAALPVAMWPLTQHSRRRIGYLIVLLSFRDLFYRQAFRARNALSASSRVAWLSSTIQPALLTSFRQLWQLSVQLGLWGPLFLLSLPHDTVSHPSTLGVPTCIAMWYGLSDVLVPLPVVRPRSPERQGTCHFQSETAPPPSAPGRQGGAGAGRCARMRAQPRKGGCEERKGLGVFVPAAALRLLVSWSCFFVAPAARRASKPPAEPAGHLLSALTHTRSRAT